MVEENREPGGVVLRDEQKQSANFAESRRQSPPAAIGDDLSVVHRFRPAQHHHEILLARYLPADAVEGDAVKKAVGDSVRIIARDQLGKRREIADEITDDSAPMGGFCPRHSERDLGSGERIAGDDGDGEVVVYQRRRAPASLFPSGRGARAGFHAQGLAS